LRKLQIKNNILGGNVGNPFYEFTSHMRWDVHGYNKKGTLQNALREISSSAFKTD
jgi:hypothetical protein